MVAFVGVHLVGLHSKGSSNPVGVNPNYDKIPFHPYFTWKDITGAVVFMSILGGITLISPWYLGDPENFTEANPLLTPLHIKPEWYFLLAYAILRSVPNKLGGVIGLVISIAMFYLFLLVHPSTPGTSNRPPIKVLF